MLAQLLHHLDFQQERVIHWQREMTARPALGPDNNGTGEQAKADWLRDELFRIGLSEIVHYNCPDNRVPCGFRPNISARIPGHSPRTLWIIAHMDVVPSGEARLWKTPPFELLCEGDFLFGRGVEDNQQAIATALLAAESLLRHKTTPNLSLGIILISDEETGMRHGLPHVLTTAPELIRPTDMILVPDMGNTDGSMVEVAEKSCLWLKFTITGQQCHASTPEQGINSLVAASACVLELERLYRIFRNKNPLFTPSWSTFVPSKKEANVENINTLPGRDVFYLDCRILPEYRIDDVEQEACVIAREVGERYKADIAVETVFREQAPPPTPVDSPVVRRLCKALEDFRGLTPAICGVGGQTVAACLRKQSLDTAVWATLMPNPHTPNECSRISATIADAKIILSMLFENPNEPAQTF